MIKISFFILKNKDEKEYNEKRIIVEKLESTNHTLISIQRGV